MQDRVRTADYEIRPISRSDCEHYILNVHYAQRFPSVSYAFGLFHHNDLVGCITYGTPFSSTLRTGLAGKENAKYVLELNRLVLKDNRPNEGSMLISKSIKQLDRNKLIISYADASMGHTGWVYQASNFLYCGLSAKRSDYVIEGKEHLHNTTIGDEFRGVPNRAEKLREKYGDAFKTVPRPRKHRYLYLHGDKKWKKQILPEIRYKITEYPSGS